VDHFGPLQQTSGNFRHIFIVIDSFTRFTWLFAVKTTKSKEVNKCLKNLFDTFGKPREIVSDRGSAFTSNEFKHFIESMQIKHRLIAVASPWSNGLVERVNRFVKSSLRKIIKSPDDWKNWLSKTQYVINNTHHSSVKNTPSKLLLGYDQRNHTDSQLTELVNDLARIDVDLETERNTIRDTAHEVTEKLRKYNKKYRDARHKPATKYKVDDLVMIRNLHAKPGQSTKFDVPYKGPYQVTKVLDFDRYVVTDIPGFNLSAKPYKAILSPDKLKPWIRPV
ncbi:Pro-Pol polyprotein, partial [Trachymyrmex cornetzi]